jgi:hypothetical protein
MIKEYILPDYPNYKLYSDGRIEALSTKKVFVNPSLTSDGYYQVNVISRLAKNGYRHSIKLHRLIALAFVPNPQGYKEVNHIDGNKLNNNADNLEWCSRSYNIKECYRLGLRSSRGKKNGNYRTGKYTSAW